MATSRMGLNRAHSNFQARTATDQAEQLDRRSSNILFSPSPQRETQPPRDASARLHDISEGLVDRGKVPSRFVPNIVQGWLGWSKSKLDAPSNVRRSSSGRRQSKRDSVPADGSYFPLQGEDNGNAKAHGVGGPRRKSLRSSERLSKLGTFSGVFVPTTLNVLSILMFLRFGFILGQSGVLGMMGMLIACYLINLLTTMSISAVASNGTVRGGGAYYLISRSLGPEFGGSIGLVFYLGFVFNTGMNAVGLIDCLKSNFGVDSGTWYNWLPEGFWWQYLWSTIVLLVCTSICLAGSSLFAKASNGLLAMVLIATFSIPLSAALRAPFQSRRLGIEYTGPNFATFRENMFPHFTKGAEGSQMRGRETFQDLFGILFPATGGIFAGASMSGDLKHPSKAIPKGTLWGLAITFFAYTVVILSMAGTIARKSFYHDVNIIQDVSLSETIILLGEFSTSFFSTLMGVIGSAKLLQAIARDHLLPGLSIFGQGTKRDDEPTLAIIVTYLVTQLTMLSDINQIASFVTMTYLMTFLVTNLACFLLKISSAPNFRPSFRYFNWWTAATGTVVSGLTMFFVDGVYASACVAMLIALFVVIHYSTPPKSWGDVSQSLIFHQVRKYLLRLRQEHVKFWRPQILLLINDPRRQYKLIQFCNSLKKGGLFILGHVIISDDFASAVPEAKRQQTAWMKYIDFSKVKSFLQLGISPAMEWGARNLVLNAGLGGMRPNIVMIGFYNLGESRNQKPLVDVSAWTSTKRNDAQQSIRRVSRTEAKLRGQLPTDTCKVESSVPVQSYLTVIEDLLLHLRVNVAVAKGFHELELPGKQPSMLDKTLTALRLKEEDQADVEKKYIDLWPIQMSAEIGDGKEEGNNIVTTNFDTYTLILQLGCILHTVPSWKRTYELRVAVFVEYETDVDEERGRVESLLNNLRIKAEVHVFWLASAKLKTYEIIVNGNTQNVDADAKRHVEDALRDEEWWQDVQKIRQRQTSVSASDELGQVEDFLKATPAWPDSSFQQGGDKSALQRFGKIRRMLGKTKNGASIGGLNDVGVSLGIQTHRLHPEIMDNHALQDSASEEESDSSEDDFDERGSLSSSESAAGQNDIDAYEGNEGKLRNGKSRASARRSRSLSISDSMRIPFFGNFGIGYFGRKSSVKSPAAAETGAQRRTGHFSSPNIMDSRLTRNTEANDGLEAQSSTDSNSAPSKRPLPRGQQSEPDFTSKPIPPLSVNAEEGAGPSIMFAEQDPRNRRPPAGSIYSYPALTTIGHNGAPQSRNSGGTATGPSTSASGFPAPAALPLSFNDLPCRAQHLILNELILSASAETAVILTTLPAPVKGTCQSEEDSIRYLNDLEVLCQDLPPVLLVHSNSMTVTMNL